MKITIDNRLISYPKSHPVKVLFDLINNNRMLLLAISKIIMSMGMLGRPTEEDIKIIVRNSLDDLVLSADITQEVADEFMDLWIDSNDNVKGKLLEELVTKFGPYKLKCDSVGHSRSSRVYETGKQKNFDIIFFSHELAKKFNKDKLLEVSGHIEFHECKKNVCNYIPCKEEDLRNDVKSKLDFMEEVIRLYSNGEIYIPTFHYNVSGQQKFLEDNGYGFVKIIDINGIIKLANSC